MINTEVALVGGAATTFFSRLIEWIMPDMSAQTGIVVVCVCGLLLPLLNGCAGMVFLGVPLTFTTTEVLPRAVNGKGLAEDGVDVVTGKDCRVIDGAVRKDRQTCEPRGSPATKKDFKGLSGLADDPSANEKR